MVKQLEELTFFEQGYFDFGLVALADPYLPLVGKKCLLLRVIDEGVEERVLEHSALCVTNSEPIRSRHYHSHEEHQHHIHNSHVNKQ